MPDATVLLERARRAQARGRGLIGTGKPQQARDVLVRALHLLAAAPIDRDTAEVSARVQITLASVEFELRGWSAAQETLAGAASLVDAHGLDGVRISLQNQRGWLALRAGRFVLAAEEFAAATPHLSAAPPNERCYLLLNRAVAHMELGEIGPAEADLQQCAATAAAAGLPLLQRMATHNQGYAAFLAGDLPRALHLMARAVDLDETASPAVMLQGRAEVLVEAGLYREADDALAQAAATFRQDRLGRDLAEVELDRARCALALGDPAAAKALAAGAARRLRRLGSESLARAAELVRIQADLATGRPPARLATDAAALAEAFTALGVRLPARIAALVGIEAAIAAGDVAGAGRRWAELGPARRTDPITGRMHSYRVAAELAAAEARAADARRTISRALGDLARYQATFGSIDLRTASAVHGRRLAQLDLTLALRDGRPGAVFAAAERARAVSARLAAVRPPEDPVAVGLLAELRQTIDALRGVEQDRVASAPLLRKRRELERQIIARSWSRVGAAGVARTAAFADVRRRLQERGESMVMYVQTADRLAAVFAGADGGRARLHDLGPSAQVVELVRRVRADLDVASGGARLPAAMRAAVTASLRRSLDGLAALLLEPVAGDGPLVVLSTGVLGQVPWATVPALAGRPISVAPSATKWLASTVLSEHRPEATLALAGPDLLRSGAEAQAVAQTWPAGDALVGAGATTTAFRAAMGRATVLHVAAHGVHQPENPLFSFVRMADGPVFAHELDQTARAPEHVVLSACEVGLATIRPGDEALGLASVLLHLGTRSVIASVARVGDEVAEQAMSAYHRRLAAGADSSVALAGALVEVDADVPPPFVNFGAAWSAPRDLEAASPVA